MEIEYREQKDFTAAQLESLFCSVNWDSGRFPNRLVTAMRNSSVVISAWDNRALVGLIRALDDGACVAFLHYLLVRPEYQKYHIGTELMNRVLEKYKDLLYIKLMPSDPETIPFYSRFGFQQRGNYSAMLMNRMPDSEDFLDSK